MACDNALRFFGGAPMAIVPDNLKAAVTRSDRNEPVINEDFAAMAEFYDMAVFPARARHPKDLGEIYERADAIDKGGVRDVDNIMEGTPA